MPKVINTNNIQSVRAASGVAAHGKNFLVKYTGFFSPQGLSGGCQVDMGDKRTIYDATKYLWTKDLATCHAVCVYGFNNTGKKGMALSHCDGRVRGTIKALRAEMGEAGLTKFAVYVIGGQPQSFEEEIEPLIDKMDKYDICLIQSPTTTSEGDGIGLVMKWDGINYAYQQRLETNAEELRLVHERFSKTFEPSSSEEED